MASYFDPKPPSKPPATAQMLGGPGAEAFGKTSLLSPQVSRILDDLELEDKSDSDDDSASLSGDGSPSDKDANGDRKSRRDLAEKHNPIRKSQTSPLPHGSKRVQIAQPPPQKHRPGIGTSKHPHLARFHSLRSILFQSHIEDNMEKYQESPRGAESKWKAEHDQRQGLNRPKTPEKEQKDGVLHKLKGGLRRMTSREVPTMQKINEDGVAADNESTASDSESERDSRPRGIASEEEIDHSDIEDLVRWVSRRDPPSDGEKRTSKAKKNASAAPHEVPKQDSGHESGHESLGHSDVDELVRWVSRADTGHPKPKIQPATQLSTIPPVKTPAREEEVVDHYGYSDASTQSDSEVDTTRRKKSIQDEDVDDLVRWVSRKEGPHAGPVRNSKNATESRSRSGSDVQDSDVEELVRWVTRKDDTSGESDVPDDKGLPTIHEHGAVDPKKSKGASKLRAEVPQVESTAKANKSLTHDDVDELVRWVSRKNPDAGEVERRDDGIEKWKEEQTELGR